MKALSKGDIVRLGQLAHRVSYVGLGEVTEENGVEFFVFRIACDPRESVARHVADASELPHAARRTTCLGCLAEVCP